MSHLLYLMFRCDGKFGKFGEVWGSKHTLSHPKKNNGNWWRNRGYGATVSSTEGNT